MLGCGRGIASDNEITRAQAARLALTPLSAIQGISNLLERRISGFDGHRILKGNSQSIPLLSAPALQLHHSALLTRLKSAYALQFSRRFLL